MVCSPLLGGGGREGGGAPRELLPQGAAGTISPKGGRTQGHATGGAARTPLTQNPHHKGERGGGRDRPSPSPLPSSPRGGCGPWALDHSWAKGQLVGPCSILDWSWSSASSRHMRGSSASCAYGQRCPCGSRQFDKTRQHSLEMDPTRVSHLALRA